MSELPEIITTPEGFSVADASPELLVDLLERFAAATARLGAPIEDYLQPRIEAAVVEDALAELGLAPPAELIAWWGWHNGVAPGRTAPLSLALLPVETAIKLYRMKVVGTQPWEWHEGWLPILGNDPDGIAVDTSRPFDQPPLVRSVNGFLGTHPEDTTHQVVSLCTPVAWWLIAREEGWTRLSSDRKFWEPEQVAFPAEWWSADLAHY